MIRRLVLASALALGACAAMPLDAVPLPDAGRTDTLPDAVPPWPSCEAACGTVAQLGCCHKWTDSNHPHDPVPIAVCCGWVPASDQ